MKRLILTALLLACALPGWAATYYVAPSPNGSDSTGNGSSGAPWATLNKANDSAANGDTVHVAAGTYVEDHVTLHYWYITKVITWIADGAVTVRAAGGDRVLNLLGGSGHSFTGFTFDAQGKNYGVMLNGLAGSASFVNCAFVASGAAAITESGAAATYTASGCSFAPSGGLVLNLNAGGGTRTITDCTMTATGAISSAIAQGAGAGTLVFTGNTLNLTRTTGAVASLNAGNLACTISDNNITLSDAAHNQTVLNLVNQFAPNISGNIIDSTASTNNCVHISLTSTGTDCGAAVISGNTLRTRSTGTYTILVGADNPSAGDNKLSGAQITGNTIYGALYYNPAAAGTTTHSIMIGYNLNTTVSRNAVYGGPYGVVFKHAGQAYTSGGCFYNLFVDCVGVCPVRVKGVRNLAVANNTIRSALAMPNAAVLVSVNGAGEPASGCTLKNNIVTGPGSLMVQVDADSASGLVSDYNDLYRADAGNLAAVGATTYANFAAWQAAGYDAHGKSADPRLRDVAGGDFRLLGGSPCINAGVAIEGLTTDYAGRTVGNPPEIGAYEFVNTGAATIWLLCD